LAAASSDRRNNGDSWTPVSNGFGLRQHLISRDQSGRNYLAGTAGYGTGVYRSTDNGDSWTLTNIGLTSTDVAALAVNGSNYHVFAGTHSIMGKGGGMFRSTDSGDTWTEQNGGFTARDVNSVVINPIGHIFAGAAGGVFRSMNDADQWSDGSSGLLPPGGNVWAVATGWDCLPRICLCRNCWRRCISQRSIHCRGAGLFRDRGLAGRQPSGPESLLITAGATRAPRWLILDQLSRCCWAIPSKVVRVTGTR